MRLRILLVAAVACSLAGPPAAGATLVVSGANVALGEAGSTTIAIDPVAPAAGLVVLAPRGFTASLEQPAGTALGKATIVTRSGGASTRAEGAVAAADPAEATCVEAPAAAWRLPGEPAPLVAVAAVGPADPEAGYASYRLTLCLAPGVLVESLDLRLDDVFRNPDQAGAYAWRSLAVPPDAAGAPAEGAAVESRSTQLLPVRLTLRGSFDRSAGKAALSGALSAAGRPLPGVRIALAAGRSGSALGRAGTATTGAQGQFEARRTLTQATVFEASAEIPSRPDPDGCPDPVAPGGCDSATLAAASVTSERVTVRAPAPRTLRLGSRGADVRRLRAELVRLRFLPPGAAGARFDERTWHAVVAFQGWRGLARTGVVDRRTWRALSNGRIPAPWARLRRGVLIDTRRQVMLLVERGRTVRAIHVSTGAYGRTPRGRFAVYRKETLSWSVPFSVWMPYASYFLGGFAMHAYPSVPTYPASHGCVRVPPMEAPGVYRFARYGTPVWVR